MVYKPTQLVNKTPAYRVDSLPCFLLLFLPENLLQKLVTTFAKNLVDLFINTIPILLHKIVHSIIHVTRIVTYTESLIPKPNIPFQKVRIVLLVHFKLFEVLAVGVNLVLETTLLVQKRENRVGLTFLHHYTVFVILEFNMRPLNAFGVVLLLF